MEVPLQTWNAPGAVDAAVRRPDVRIVGTQRSGDDESRREVLDAAVF
ncbi:MAG TPA: hypothetical protein VHQ47_12950 [Phycisphaerae bacterium]|jgi:hypothetical protein|nr:hypothetical protein [Phycisphaerae bacterium]